MNTAPRMLVSRMPAADELSTLDWLQQRSRSFPLLTPDQERELAARVKEGRKADTVLRSCSGNPRRARVLAVAVREGQAALDTLVTSNLRLVVAMARGYQGQGVPLLDLIQEGNIGLMTAARKFDGDRTVRFSTYAAWWVRRGFTRAIIDKGRGIRLSEDAWMAVRRYRRASLALADCDQEGAIPREQAMSERLGLPLAALRDVQRWAELEPISLSASTVADRTVEESVADPAAELAVDEILDGIEGQLQLSWLHGAVFTLLTDEERRVVQLRYGLGGEGPGYSLRETGRRLTLSPGVVRALEERAMAKLRAAATALGGPEEPCH